jgi:hypothetical protein
MDYIELWSFKLCPHWECLIYNSTRESKKPRLRKIAIYCLCIFFCLEIAKANDTLTLVVFCTYSPLSCSESYKIYFSNQFACSQLIAYNCQIFNHFSPNLTCQYFSILYFEIRLKVMLHAHFRLYLSIYFYIYCLHARYLQNCCSENLSHNCSF